MQYFLGIDVSTTASKAVVIDELGVVVASHSVMHESFSVPGKPLWAEQRPENWCEATFTAIKSVLKKINPYEIKSVSLTGQMQGLVVLDKNYKPLRPAILWNDQRSSQECNEIEQLLEKEFGKDFLCQRIGSKSLPCHLAPKLLWIMKNENISNQIALVMTPKDYVRFCITGVLGVDESDASGYGFLNIASGQWSSEILEKLSIPPAWLPRIYRSTEECGKVSAEGARLTHLIAGTPVAAGAGDQPAQSIGCGMVKPGAMSLQIGTSGVISQIGSYTPAPDGSYLDYCHAAPNQWIAMGLTAAAAGSFRWFRDQIAKNYSFKELDEMASKIAPGSDGLIFIPDICGNIHPHGNALARGHFIGLTERHTLAHMARAVLEGVAFSMREMVDLMCSKSKYNPDGFIISGGAANSPLWKTIFAEIMGKPLYSVNCNEGAAFGAAIIAGVAVGFWPDLDTACNKLIKKTESIQPNRESIEQYQKVYQIWKDIYPLLETINSRLASLPVSSKVGQQLENVKTNNMQNEISTQTLFHQYGKWVLGATALASGIAGLAYLSKLRH